jgi:CxxC-x17-CxxC domain-containing protein
MPEFADKVLTCVDCGTGFLFTAGEQLFFAEKNFRNYPKRCKACKQKRSNPTAPRSSPPGRVETPAVCSQCGKATTLPFRPTQGRPVFCRECFVQRRALEARA